MTDPRLARLSTLAMRLWQDHGREPPLPGLRLSSTPQPTGPFHGVYTPSLCVVLQGAKESHVGSRHYRYDAGKCLIASLQVPIRAEITDAAPDLPYLAFALEIDPAVVAELLLGQEAEPALPMPEAVGVHRVPDSLIGPLERYLALQPRDLPVLGPMIRREICWHLLNGPHGASLREIGLAESRMARVGRAISWIRDNFAETLSVPHLADLAGMSPATFHRHFKMATAMTPMQYQKGLRLQEARRLMLTEGADVARVGYSIGYESPSQFSREYRRFFGAPPGRDGVQIRQQLSAGR